jgi:YVTN family beta-propeller protein
LRRRHLVLVGGALGLLALTVQAAGASTGPAPMSLSTPMASPAGLTFAGPRRNGTGVLPDGRFVTPVGRSKTVELQPLNSTVSHDGRRLYVTSEGYNDAPTPAVEHDNAPKRRFLTVLDTRTHQATKVEDDALNYGVAESSDGRTVYVSEGQSGSVGVFGRTPPAGDPGAPGSYLKRASIVLDPAHHADYPWGLALSPRGDRLYVAGFETNTLIALDTATGRVLSRVGTGEYPYGVAVSPDGQRVYVTNWGLYNQDAAPVLSAEHLPLAVPPATIGGYNSDRSSSLWTYQVAAGGPEVVAETRIGRPLNGADVVGGPLPSALALSPDGRRLAVTSSNGDLVEILDVNRTVIDPAAPTEPAHPRRIIDMRVVPGGPTGAQPDAVAWAPGGLLLVAEGGRNSVAVVDDRRVHAGYESPGTAVPDGWNAGAVLGRLPTAWYPTAVVLGPDGRLWVTSNMGLGSGPNTGTGPEGGGGTSAASYIPDTLFGSVQEVQLASALRHLPSLTRTSDVDNGFVQAGRSQVGDGAVVPAAYGQGPSPSIKHVFLIIKENRPYDQELGDLVGTERDQRFTFYGSNVTPNTHALARRFSMGDNFYALSETSVDGHYSIDTGQINEFVLKTTPSSYAGKFPYDHFQTSPENLPQGGFIWDNAARNHVPTRVYGEGTFVVGIGPEQLGKGTAVSPAGLLQPGVTAGDVTYDPTYPSQVNLQGMAPTPTGVAAANAVYPYNDEGRVSAFRRQMAAFDTAGVMPNLNVMLLFDDHTDGYLPGHPSPEAHIAENDHALGEIVDTISHSPFWKDSAIFVAEDDTQSGQDHVDAHRTFGLMMSPYARAGHVSHVHTSFASMVKTINLMLGLPPTSTQEMAATSMADFFIGRGGRPNFAPYTTLPNRVFSEVNPSVSSAPNPASRQAAELAQVMPPGIDRAGDLLGYDLAIGRQGALQSHDPNVVAQPDVVEHTLSSSSPPAQGTTDGGAGGGDGAGDAAPAVPEH